MPAQPRVSEPGPARFQKQLHSCRFCGAEAVELFIDLGAMPLANSYPCSASESEPAYPLIARVCQACLLVQVDESVPPEEIFSEYTYFSSYASSWVDHAKRYAQAMQARFDLTSSSYVVEIASNDGYLLQHFAAMSIPVLGIEPAHNVAEVARAKGIATRSVFFDRMSAAELAREGVVADLIPANNVFAHVPHIRDFAAGFPLILKPGGVVTIEFPSLLSLIEKVEFDTIYHEHFSYLSLSSAERVLRSVGLRVFDVEKLSTHGGSLRLFACHEHGPHRQQASVETMRAEERAAKLDRIEGYRGFREKAEHARRSFLNFLDVARKRGKSVAAYGAPAKGNTFLNFCGVSASDIRFTVDLNPEKQNRFLPGSRIPIFAPERLREERPDYVVILPWNLADEIRSEWDEIRSWGGRFVVAIPETRIL